MNMDVLSGICGKDSNIYILYRPVGECEGKIRQFEKLIQIEFDDDKRQFLFLADQLKHSNVHCV